MDTFLILDEVLKIYNVEDIVKKIEIHKGTIKRWIDNKKVPNNYFNDLNKMINYKYPSILDVRTQDQFYTKEETAKHCIDILFSKIKELGININEYNFIEPSAGCCSFYKLLPKDRRIGIDLFPNGVLKNELIKNDYLDFSPKDTNKKYIVVGNPPFGLRGNMALRFINHSYTFADIVAFILPPLFMSTGKGVPMKRVKGYQLYYSENLKENSFMYPNGKDVDVKTLFQIWVKDTCCKISSDHRKQCNTFLKVYSLSDGGTPASTRNKKMLNKCDIYLPSTCYSGMKVYNSFNELPNKRGYGVVFYKEREKLNNLYKKTDWQKVAFYSTNNAINLRSDLIENVAIKAGFYD